MTDETIAMCALGRIFGFKPLLAHALVRELGSAAAVFNLSEGQKEELLGSGSKYPAMLSDYALEQSRSELTRLTGEGGSFISFSDRDYPELLRECEDAPLGLYYKGAGAPSECFRRQMVSVVGTRDISLYGTEWCRRIVAWLAEAGQAPAVVSGMALGADIVAHRAALESGLPTVGVMPTGIDDVYPARHRPDAGRMLRTPGCALITDYPPRTSPVAINFIRRNRIIAGMSTHTILIESKEKGGAMITARLANSYGRELLVLPGRIDDLRSSGCITLLREKLAEPVTDAASFLDSLGLRRTNIRKPGNLASAVRRRLTGALDRTEITKAEKTALAIKEERGISIEELSVKLGMPYQEAAFLTRLLEAEGFIKTDVLQRCSIVVKIV